MISTPPDVYTDLQGLSRLRSLTRKDSGKALDIVAQQFEALFLQMMLKSVQESSFGDPLFGSQQMDFYRDMHDKQLSVDLAHKGGMGIADMLVQQLGKQLPQRTEAVSGGSYSVPDRLSLRAISPVVNEPVTGIRQSRQPLKFDSPTDFVKHLWPGASKAAADLGVSPEVLLAQAALETGWGKKIIQMEPGISSHNLFNIKADRRWKGEKAGVSTLEYINGAMVKQRAAFRVYDSYAESFSDYVNFLRTNPRYGEALQKTDNDAAFVTALHKAGYATDPHYAAKIQRILDGRVMASAVDAVKFSASDPILSYEVALAGDDK